MSAWHHCDKPEPHGFHEWYPVEEREVNWGSMYACPGVKNTNEMHSRVRRRDALRAQLDEAEAALREASVRYRRTPHQFYMNDDNAPEEDPDART